MYGVGFRVMSLCGYRARVDAEARKHVWEAVQEPAVALSLLTHRKVKFADTSGAEMGKHLREAMQQPAVGVSVSGLVIE